MMTDAKFLYEAAKLIREVEGFRNDYNFGEKYYDDVNLEPMKNATAARMAREKRQK